MIKEDITTTYIYPSKKIANEKVLNYQFRVQKQFYFRK